MSNEIKTWQERTGNHNARPGSMKHMLAEIDDLRAALASERTLLNAATSEMEAMEKERDEARAALAQLPAPAAPVVALTSYCNASESDMTLHPNGTHFSSGDEVRAHDIGYVHGWNACLKSK